MRAGVASIFSAEAGREAGLRIDSQETAPITNATMTRARPPTIFRKVFMMLFSPLERFCGEEDRTFFHQTKASAAVFSYGDGDIPDCAAGRLHAEVRAAVHVARSGERDRARRCAVIRQGA